MMLTPISSFPRGSKDGHGELPSNTYTRSVVRPSTTKATGAAIDAITATRAAGSGRGSDADRVCTKSATITPISTARTGNITCHTGNS